MPSCNLQKNTTVQLSARKEMHFSGPIPPPELLQAYDAACPGAADRILKMAEKQLDHRVEIENQVVSANIYNSKVGLYFGGGIGIVGVSGAVYLLSIGVTAAGVGVLLSTLGPLVGLYIYGMIKKEKDKQETQNNQQEE